MARYTDIDNLIAEYDQVHVGPAGGARKLMTEAPIADVAPKSEVAREIFAEIEEALQYEIDLEDKNGRNAWGEGDTIGFHIHEYAEDKLDTLKIALSLLKKKYTEGNDG